MSFTPYSDELRLAEKVANRIGSKWHAVEIEDLTSHLYLWIMENGRAVERWRGEEGGLGKLYVSLKREAAKYCAKEQAAVTVRPIRADSFYTVPVVERALPFVFEDTPQTTVHVNPVTGEPQSVPFESNMAVTVMSDVRGAFWGLPAELRTVLEYRFRDGLTFEEIGELEALTKNGAQKRVERAVQRLADALTGERF